VQGRLFRVDDVPGNQVPEVVFQLLHSQRPAGDDGVADLLRFRFADEVADRGRPHHDLERRDPARTVRPLHELLA